MTLHLPIRVATAEVDFVTLLGHDARHGAGKLNRISGIMGVLNGECGPSLGPDGTNRESELPNPIYVDPESSPESDL